MLNQLKNNELASYFRKLALGSRLDWLDIADLKNELRLHADRYSDECLEVLFYGSQDQPVYSGFTEKRVREYAAFTGLAVSVTPASQGFYRSGAVTALLAAKAEEGPLAANRKLIQRERKRKWKAALVERCCRTREKWLTNVLNKEDLKLNLGAGSETHPGYVKVDWAGPQDIFDDIVILEKISSGSVSEIYSNHVLEHVPAFLIPSMLKRWHAVLKPGGILRLRMPDAKQAVLHLDEEWCEVSELEVKSLKFPNYLAKENTFTGKVDEQLAIQFIYGWSDTMPGFWDASNQHKSLWTPNLGKKRLEEQGFTVSVAQNFGTLQTVLIATKES